jgi:hypothetical protein
MDTVGQSPRRRGRINVRSPSKYQWAVLEVAALRFTNPQIPLMTAVKQIVTPEKCRLHGHPVTGHEERIRNIYALCKEHDDFGRYGLTNHLLDRKGRSERQRSELYDPTKHADAPVGTEKRVVYGSPEWVHACRNGWQPIKQWPDGTYTIRRDSPRGFAGEPDDQMASSERDR